MTISTEPIKTHPEEQLSGYIDGELTQQKRQAIERHCEQCESCRARLEELASLRLRVGKSHLSEIGEDKWRETMNDATVNISRNIGWLLFLAGLMVIIGFVLYQFAIGAEIATWLKLAIAAVYGGLFVLLLSVLKQRLVESKTDKYKNVEI